MAHDDIRIGTLVKADRDPISYLKQILPYGFESFQLTFPSVLGGMDVKQLATDVRAVLNEQGSNAVISSVGIYGNPLVDPRVADGFVTLIDAADAFGCKLVCGFAGRIVDRPVPESMSKFREVFTPLAKRAEDRGVRIAFENCDMRGTWETGDWNIAHAPAAWEMMFDAVPSPAIGLEWEPCHQMVSLIDPLPQLRKWVDKVFHLHGKDATVMWDVVRTYGIRGGKTFVHHRTPGFGDTNWSDVITILRQGGFRGAIDIEGWHDPVYRGDLEMTGQVRALRYLKECRGGDFVPNPT
ncbi:MAG TPA: sugar phosphate isomerase/epimerase family protein [Pirellulales bacterium]|nr:sugar phosphate isomerase/epimerase family protein [Pirellulales bacterium]